jgi:hypothetical protein
VKQHEVGVFDNQIIRRNFGPKERLVVTTGCTKLYNNKLHNMYSSPGTVKTIRLREMRWEVYAVRMKKIRTKFQSEKLKESDNLWNRGVDGMVISC